MTEARELLRQRYEDLYRQAWLKQIQVDKQKNPKLAAPIPDYNKARENGLKGGRPKKPPMTANARIINNMMQKGMTLREIGKILERSHQAVQQIATRYGLPRND